MNINAILSNVRFSSVEDFIGYALTELDIEELLDLPEREEKVLSDLPRFAYLNTKTIERSYVCNKSDLYGVYNINKETYVYPTIFITTLCFEDPLETCQITTQDPTIENIRNYVDYFYNRHSFVTEECDETGVGGFYYIYSEKNEWDLFFDKAQEVYLPFEIDGYNYILEELENQKPACYCVNQSPCKQGGIREYFPVELKELLPLSNIPSVKTKYDWMISIEDFCGEVEADILLIDKEDTNVNNTYILNNDILFMEGVNIINKDFLARKKIKYIGFLTHK